MESPWLISSINSCFVHHLVWISLSVSSINSCLHIIWYGKSIIGLIHQQLFRTLSGTDSFSSLIHQQLFVHHLVWKVLPWSDPSTVASYIIWYGFLQFSHPSAVVCTWSGVGSPSLVSTVNSCFMHHLVWIPSSATPISSCIVHHLACMVGPSLAWSTNSCFVHQLVLDCFSYLIHQQLLIHHLVWMVFHLSQPSTSTLCGWKKLRGRPWDDRYVNRFCHSWPWHPSGMTSNIVRHM